MSGSESARGLLHVGRKAPDPDQVTEVPCLDIGRSDRTVDDAFAILSACLRTSTVELR
jgi:hypothetical protein